MWLFACRCIKGEPAIEEYYEMHAEAEEHNEQISKAVMQSSVTQPFLTPGRVVVVKSQSVSYFNILVGMYQSILFRCSSISYALVTSVKKM